MIITDGDAAPDTRGRREAGLKRGAGLHSDSAEGAAFLRRVTQLPEGDAADYATQREATVRELEGQGVFIGAQTLEIDLCRMFGQEITTAFRELSPGSAAIADVENGVADHADSQARAKMVARISDLGKGRFAQRLAAHLACLDLLAMVRTAAGIDDSATPVDASMLRQLGPASYLFLALEAISHQVRGTSLFPTLDGDDANRQGG